MVAKSVSHHRTQKPWFLMLPQRKYQQTTIVSGCPSGAKWISQPSTVGPPDLRAERVPFLFSVVYILVGEPSQPKKGREGHWDRSTEPTPNTRLFG